MDTCGVCEREKAGFLCLCEHPFLRICNGCVGLHVSRPSKNSHSLEPFACREFLKSPSDIPRYRERQIAIYLANSALDQNFDRLEVCKQRILDIQKTVNTWVSEKLAALERVEAQLQEDVAVCKKKTQELGFSANPVVDSKLVAVVLGPDGRNEATVGKEMTMFQTKESQRSDIQNLLDNIIEYQVMRSPLSQAIFVPSSNPFASLSDPQISQRIAASAGQIPGNSASLQAKPSFVFGSPSSGNAVPQVSPSLPFSMSPANSGFDSGRRSDQPEREVSPVVGPRSDGPFAPANLRT